MNCITRKKELRTDLLSQRRRITEEQVYVSSKRICDFLYSWQKYQDVNTIMLFLPMKDEPQIQPVFEHAWSLGKRLCIPYLGENYGHMDAVELNSFQDLVPGKFNLLVPGTNELKIVLAKEIDLIIVPAVAYSLDGSRLGMGGGYYDRFLLRAENAIRVGVCWTSYIVEWLPTEAHDEKVDFILTDAGFYSCFK